MSPSARTEAGYRLYSEKDAQKLRRILNLKHLGLSLEEVDYCLKGKLETLIQLLALKRNELQSQRDTLDIVLRILDVVTSSGKAQTSAPTIDWPQIDNLIHNQKQQMTTLSTHSTFTNALKAARQQLVQDEQVQYLQLLDEETVRVAIRTAMTSYTSNKQSDEYINEVIRPLLARITEANEWPQNAEFGIHYSVTEDIGGRKSMTFKGLGFGIEIETPEAEFAGFSLPVLEAWYGRWV